MDIITPSIIGDSIGLHPVMVIVSIFCFADLFGFWGVLLAIPTIAVFKVIWLTAQPYYMCSKAYLGPQPEDNVHHEEREDASGKV